VIGQCWAERICRGDLRAQSAWPEHGKRCTAPTLKTAAAERTMPTCRSLPAWHRGPEPALATAARRRISRHATAPGPRSPRRR